MLNDAIPLCTALLLTIFFYSAQKKNKTNRNGHLYDRPFFFILPTGKNKKTKKKIGHNNIIFNGRNCYRPERGGDLHKNKSSASADTARG